MIEYRQVVRIALYDTSSLDDPRFLVLHKKPNGKHNGYMEFPGGGVDPGENALDAVVRECREELGLRPRSLDHRPITSGGVKLVEKNEQQTWELYFGIAPDIDLIVPSQEIARVESLPVGSIVEQMVRYQDLQCQARALDAWVQSDFSRYRFN